MDPLTRDEVLATLDDARWDAGHADRLARARAARTMLAPGVWIRHVDRQAFLEACAEEVRALGGAARLAEEGWLERLVLAWNARLPPPRGRCGWWRVDAGTRGSLSVDGEPIDTTPGGGWWVSHAAEVPVWSAG
jgi:hypothetical protein